MPLRIAIGSASCETINPHDKIGQRIKELILNKIEFFKGKDFEFLHNFSDYTTVEYNIENKLVELAFFKEVIDNENLLFVVRAAYRTINFPTYICWGFIGRVYAEGIIINSKNESKKADDSLLWEFK